MSLTPAESTALATWVMTGVLALTAFLIGRQIREAVSIRRQQSRPYVVVSLDVEQRSLIMLVIENAGTTPAYDVTVAFDQSPQSTLHDLADVRMLVEPIPMIPPGRRLRAMWDQGFTVLEEAYPHPVSYRPTVRYRDQDGHWYGPEEYVLDFRQYDGLALGPPGMPELVKALEAIASSLKDRR